MAKLLKKLFEYNVIKGGGHYDDYHQRLVNLGNFIWNGNFYKAGVKQQSQMSGLRDYMKGLLTKKYSLDGTGTTDPKSKNYDPNNRDKVINIKLTDDETGHAIVDDKFRGYAEGIMPWLISPKVNNGLPADLTVSVGIVNSMGFFDPTKAAPEVTPHNKVEKPAVAKLGTTKNGLQR